MFPIPASKQLGANPAPRTVSLDLPGLFKHPLMKYKPNPVSYVLSVLTATVALIGAGGPLQAQDKKPNIVIIWGDDIGYWGVFD